MGRSCTNCKIEKQNTDEMVLEENQNIMMPYVAHQAEVARQERQIKRMWIALIVAISMLFSSFALFVWYESQFETMTYEQDGEGINNVNYGEQGDLNNVPESKNQEEEEE